MLKNLADRIFGSPHYLQGLYHFARLGGLLQLGLGLFFFVLSRFGGPLGCLEIAEILTGSALRMILIGFALRLGISLWNRRKTESSGR